MDTEGPQAVVIYEVVVNQDEQYSIWPADRLIPVGWKSVGSHGTQAECFVYIKQNWHDMRPTSVRQQMTARMYKTEGK